MPTTCVITFENRNRVYYAGQTIRGTVNLTIIEEEKLRSVYVRIFGRTYANWTEYCAIDHNHDRNRNKNQVNTSGHRVSYSGEKIYLDDKLYLFGDSNSSKIFLTIKIKFVSIEIFEVFFAIHNK